MGETPKPPPQASSFASLERTLDRTIECLVGGPQNREARALLIEARRLRSVIANWRSIPPPPAVRDEMLERVVQLSTGVGAAFPDALPEIAAAVTQGPQLSGDEETEGDALDFEPQLYSLEGASPARPVTAHTPPLETRGPPARQAMPPLAEAAPESLPVSSEDEPTLAFDNRSLQALTEPEPSVPFPAPWPVEEPPEERISSVVAAPREAEPPQPAAPAPAEPPKPAAQAVTGHSHPPEALKPPAQPEADSRASAPRIVTYEFDPDGDDLSVPRTQIAAHAVRLSDPVDPLFVVLTDAYSPRADAYRTLRRKLAATPQARVLGVTSAEPGEGKTVFAVNLALTLRESARSRVLIIEANLRAPSLARMLGFDAPLCFIEQLKLHADDPRAPWVVAEPLPKLHVMAVDPRVPHEPVLEPVTFSTGMERIKQAGYEYVIIDAPPVLGSHDCNVISDAVDAMILTALPMKSRRGQMRKAVEQLEPAPILGVVVLEA